MWLELVISFLATAAAGVWVMHGSGAALIDTFLKDNRGQVYGALASIFGALLGFAITAVSIILGFSTTKQFDILRQSKHYPLLWAIFTSAIRWLGGATLVALVGLVADRDKAPQDWILLIGFFVSAVATWRVVNCVWAVERTIAVITKPTSTVEGR